jgi:hypothetical protein
MVLEMYLLQQKSLEPSTHPGCLVRRRRIFGAAAFGIAIPPTNKL